MCRLPTLRAPQVKQQQQQMMKTMMMALPLMPGMTDMMMLTLQKTGQVGWWFALLLMWFLLLVQLYSRAVHMRRTHIVLYSICSC
jgi:hypothetical protein